MFSKLLAKNRIRINSELPDPEARKFYSPATYGAHQVTMPAIQRHARGKLIDIGCGDMPFKSVLEGLVSEYHSFDVERRVPEVMMVGDIQNMDTIRDNCYDSALCFEVLEHVPDPFRAVAEVYRILKPGGELICSVPHLSRLHEEPHDYFRYTKYGLVSMFERAGFEIVYMEPRGGLFSFLGHQLSTLLLCSTWHIPLVKQITFFLNKLLCVWPCHWLDKAIDKGRIFALGYTFVVRKK